MFHNYQSLVRAGRANPMLCPNCDFRLASLRNERDEPTFWCPSCDSRYYVGTRTYEDMKKAIRNAIGE